jgi:hypothetical protein
MGTGLGGGGYQGGGRAAAGDAGAAGLAGPGNTVPGQGGYPGRDHTAGRDAGAGGLNGLRDTVPGLGGYPGPDRAADGHTDVEADGRTARGDAGYPIRGYAEPDLNVEAGSTRAGDAGGAGPHYADYAPGAGLDDVPGAGRQDGGHDGWGAAEDARRDPGDARDYLGRAGRGPTADPGRGDIAGLDQLWGIGRGNAGTGRERATDGGAAGLDRLWGMGRGSTRDPLQDYPSGDPAQDYRLGRW